MSHPKSPFRKILAVLATIVTEGISMIIGMFLYFVNLEKRNPKRINPDQIPILMVHGYLLSSGEWLYFRDRLKNAGFSNVFTINLGSPFHSIDEYARKVKDMADRIAAMSGRKELILIGKSMGGLVSLHYANTYAPKDSVKDIITLGSPLEGTWIAYFAIGACGRDMRPGSCFLKELASFKPTARFFHIASEVDPIIHPWQSALFYSNQAEAISRYTFPAMGHMQMYFSKKTAALAIRYLTSSQQS